MKKLFCFAFVSLACFMTACSTVTSDLTEEQGDIIAEYAADILLKYDKNYSDKYVESQPTTEEATFAEEIEYTTPEESTSGKKDNADGKETTKPVEETTTEPVLSSIEQILGIDGIKVTYKDFLLTDTYPNDSKDNFFVMKAVKGTKLLILRFDVKNVSGNDIALNIMKSNAKYRTVINDSDKLVAQITLLLNAFNTYEGTIKANKSEEMVLVFQTNVKSKSDIKNMSLDIYCGEKQGTITLK
ncbi:MAG: hypothetical protein IJC76_00385 [Lachnospiraceae bacterium]|nr:hypothetical protein [Lachnospiraceae bacterium]